jgi:hypothetical protein
MPSNSAVLLEELQARVQEAQKKLAETSQQLQQAQQAQAQAQQQFSIWSGALQTISREQIVLEAAAKANQLPLPGAKPVEATVPPITSAEAESHGSAEPVNKTEIILELVRQHPMGISASDIWRQAGNQLKHRPYLYNVLKRLRDREEITLRRNKYAIKPHAEVSQPTVVQ